MRSPTSNAVGEALKQAMRAAGKTVDMVSGSSPRRATQD